MIKTVLKRSIFAALFAISSANATTLTFDLDHNFGGDTTTGNVVVTITEASATGDIHFAISNLTPGYLNEIFFNYAPNTDIAGGVISNFTATNGVVGSPSVKYNGTQGFAIVFDFPNQPGPNFTNGESVSFDLGANADLSVSNFNSLGGNPFGDDFYVSARINGAQGSDSKIADINGGVLVLTEGLAESDPIGILQDGEVPAPSGALLMGLGLVSFACVRRRPIPIPC